MLVFVAKDGQATVRIWRGKTRCVIETSSDYIYRTNAGKITIKIPSPKQIAIVQGASPRGPRVAVKTTGNETRATGMKIKI